MRRSRSTGPRPGRRRTRCRAAAGAARVGSERPAVGGRRPAVDLATALAAQPADPEHRHERHHDRRHEPEQDLHASRGSTVLDKLARRAVVGCFGVACDRRLGFTAPTHSVGAVGGVGVSRSGPRSLRVSMRCPRGLNATPRWCGGRRSRPRCRRSPATRCTPPPVDGVLGDDRSQITARIVSSARSGGRSSRAVRALAAVMVAHLAHEQGQAPRRVVEGGDHLGDVGVSRRSTSRTAEVTRVDQTLPELVGRRSDAWPMPGPGLVGAYRGGMNDIAGRDARLPDEWSELTKAGQP